MTQFFNPAQDAQQLKEALEKPRNIDTIISIAAHRSNAQRQQIVQAYYNENKKNIRDDFRSVFSGNFQEALVSLFYEPVDYDCHQIYSAMKGIGTNEDTLIEIIASRNNEQLAAIKQCYNAKYQRDLEADIKKETHGTLEHLLVSLIQGKRSYNPHPDQGRCRNR